MAIATTFAKTTLLLTNAKLWFKHRSLSVNVYPVAVAAAAVDREQ